MSRRLSIFAALALSAFLGTGCNQPIPDEINTKGEKKKDYKEYRPHRYPWEQGGENGGGSGSSGKDYWGPIGSSGGGHNPAPHSNHH